MGPLVFRWSNKWLFFYTVVLGNTATEMMVNLVMFSGGLAFWTGLAKWQLPRIRKWRKKVNSA